MKSTPPGTASCSKSITARLQEILAILADERCTFPHGTRIEEQVLRGEIDNRRPGRVIGKSGSPDVTRRWNWSWRVEEMNAIAAEALVDLEAEKWKGPEAEEEEAHTPQWRQH